MKAPLFAIALTAALALPAAAATRSDAGEAAGGKASAKADDDPETVARAEKILAALEAAEGGAQDRLRRINDLVTMSPTPVLTLEKFLARERETSSESRRQILQAIGAAVPDARGRFRSAPKREDQEVDAESDAFDWAALLVERPRSKALGEILADVAAIRALARSEDPRGARLILDFAFTETGTIYRDECGRNLRKGQPWSIPGLIRGTDADKLSIRRYATYQLERIDREAPHKALRAARGNEPLQVEIYRAFADSLFREALYTVLDNLDNGSPVLRRAARETWRHYITREPSRPPPKKKLTLPGGDLTKKPVPLYLSHLELADIELRNRLEEITGTAPARDATLEEMTDQLIAHYDEKRKARHDALLAEARKAERAGDLAAAIERLDQLLVARPDHPARREMAATYLARGRELLEAKEYRDAAVVLRKAHDIDPEGPAAKQALAKVHVARARMIEAAGGDSAAELARARDIDPGATDGSTGPRWMLFVGVGGALAGVLLLLAGIVLRRRRA